MSRNNNGGDKEARRPLLNGNQLDPTELDSDEGEVIFDRRSSVISDESGGTATKRLTYEEAVEEAGFGLFHWLLLAVCGWANASDAVEILCVSFLLPTARCDLLLSSSDMGLLTASIFLGMMVGGYMWGYLADQRGRRKVLVVSLTVNGLFGGLASAAPWFWLFLLLRFISGIGVGGSIPVIFSYFSEFMPRLRRGAMISALATFWMAGNILAAGLAWLVIPRTWARFSLGTLDFQSWRLFVVLCSVPSTSSAILFKLLMPESPKFLMEAGRAEEAIRVFRLMFEMNMKGTEKAFPEFALRTNSKPGGEIREIGSGDTKRKHLMSVLKQGLLPIKQMFSGSVKARSIVLLIIFYCISFGYYGLWMWFPELFARVESSGGSPCANVSMPSALNNQSCYPVKTAVYMEGFIIAASNLPGNIFTILIMDSTGGKTLLLQPDRVQPERLPHLRGPDQSPESGSVLHLQWGLCDRLECSGRGGNRALPDPAKILGPGFFHRSGPSGGHHGERGLREAGGLQLHCSHPAGVGPAADGRPGGSSAPTDQADGAHLIADFGFLETQTKFLKFSRPKRIWCFCCLQTILCAF